MYKNWVFVGSYDDSRDVVFIVLLQDYLQE